jgi:hypothetical protein
MTVWKLRVQLDPKGQPQDLYAEDVDFNSFPLIWIKKIREEKRSTLITLPDSDSYQEFSQFDLLVIPYNHLLYAGRSKEKTDAVLQVFPAITDSI